MVPKSFYAITWACGPRNLFYNSALPRNRTLYICCSKSDTFVELFVCCGTAAQRRSWLSHSWGFQITHNSTPNSVVLLWTSDRHVAETSTCHLRTLTTDNHVRRGIRTHNLSRPKAADLQLRSRALPLRSSFIELTRLNYKQRKKHAKTHGTMKKFANPRSDRKYIAFLT